MRVHCTNCEAPFFESLASTERFPHALCRACRREKPTIDPHEIPPVRVYGVEKEMGRWFDGLIPNFRKDR